MIKILKTKHLPRVAIKWALDESKQKSGLVCSCELVDHSPLTLASCHILHLILCSPSSSYHIIYKQSKIDELYLV